MTDSAFVIQGQPTDVWVFLRSGCHNVTDHDFDPTQTTPLERAVIKGLLQAALDIMEEEE